MKKQIFWEDTKRLRSEIRSLAIYNKKAYKQVIFKENIRELIFSKLNDTEYYSDLFTDSLFEKVYGKVRVVVEIKKDKMLIKRIEPEEILLAGYRRLLDTYYGIPYRNKKDLFKIKYYERLKNGNIK